MGVHPYIGRALTCAATAHIFRARPCAATAHIFRALTCAAVIGIYAALPVASASADLQSGPTTEDRAIGAFLAYCLPAVTAGDSVVHIAETRKLKTLPTSEQDVYLQGASGKVFELPEVGHGVVLSAPNTPTCSVMLDRVDAREFLNQASYWFGADHSPFRLTVNKTLVNGDIQREYRADIDGKTVLLQLSLRLQPVQGGIQAMLTGGRAE